MEINKSLVLFLAAVATTTMIFDSCTAQAPPLTPPSSPSSNTSCLFELTFACQGTSSTSPSSSCCTALGKAYSNEYDCLCFLSQSANATKQLGFNSTDIPDLLVECKVINSTDGLCKNSSFPFPPSNSPFSLFAPPDVHASPPPGSGNAVMIQTLWTGMSGLTGFILLYLFFWY